MLIKSALPSKEEMETHRLEIKSSSGHVGDSAAILHNSRNYGFVHLVAEALRKYDPTGEKVLKMVREIRSP